MSRIARILAAALGFGLIASGARCQSLFDYSAVQAEIEGGAFTAEVQRLPVRSGEDAAARLLVFRANAGPRHRVDGAPDDTGWPEGTATVSQKTADTVLRSLAGDEADEGFLATRSRLLEAIPGDRRWTLLEALERGKYYTASSRLAEQIALAEAEPADRDLAMLVAARSAWLSKSGEDPRSGAFLNLASESEDEAIRAQALLWREATTAPLSFETVSLAYQVWVTVRLDERQRLKEGQRSKAVLDGARSAYETVKLMSDPAERGWRSARLAAMGSVVAFQWTDVDAMIFWAAVAREIDARYAIPEDLLMPAYSLAFQAYSQDDLVGAAEAFEPVFLSAVSCPVSANAGIKLAQCLWGAGMANSAVGVLDLLIDLYPHEELSVRKAKQLRDAYRRADGFDQQLASFYRTESLEPQVAKALSKQSDTVASADK